MAEQKTTIVFLTYQNIVKNLEKVVDEFESKHPDIDVKLNGYPFEQMFEVIETKMQVKSDEIDILNVDAPFWSQIIVLKTIWNLWINILILRKKVNL